MSGKSIERLAFADIDNDGCAFDLSGLAHQTRELGQKFQRQVIDRVVTQVLK